MEAFIAFEAQHAVATVERRIYTVRKAHEIAGQKNPCADIGVGLQGIRNRALLSIGFDFLTRRSELASLRTRDLELQADGAVRGLIRRSKVAQFTAAPIRETYSAIGSKHAKSTRRDSFAQ